MYSSEDFEKLWFLYKLEGQPKSQKSVGSRREPGRDDDKRRLRWHPKEYVTYRTKAGRVITCFYPQNKPAQGSVSETLSEDVCVSTDTAASEEEQIPRNFPGTHATVDMLVELVFNAYMLETPVYRDMIRLFELKFNVSRQTILIGCQKAPIASSLESSGFGERFDYQLR